MLRIGIDLGGTKTEGVVMTPDSRIVERLRWATPFDSYARQIDLIAQLVAALEASVGERGLTVGIGHPGAISPSSGLIKNANSTCLNGKALLSDLVGLLGPRVRLANDANCLALSEAIDGAAQGAKLVFGVILGTGVGGGIVHRNELIVGPGAVAGEWGHNPLPWPRLDWGEYPGPLHWDGRRGAIEAWLSGPGLAADHARRWGGSLTGEAIVAAADGGDGACEESMRRYEHRLARSLATVINLLDPDVIVLGGGLSRIDRLYRQVPALWTEWVFSDHVATRLVPATHGDSSGVRGAAWLWAAGEQPAT